MECLNDACSLFAGRLHMIIWGMGRMIRTGAGKVVALKHLQQRLKSAFGQLHFCGAFADSQVFGITWIDGWHLRRIPKTQGGTGPVWQP